VVRTVADSDENVSILESYTGLTINPNSADYIARRIGDMDMSWDGVKRQYTELGNYPNVSNYITVEVHSDVENGNVDPEALPFGFFGPPRYKSMTLGLNATGSAFNPREHSFAIGGSGVPYWPINAVVTPLMAWLSGSHSTDHSSSAAGPKAEKGDPTGFPELLLPLAFPSLEDWLRVKATDGTGEGPVELENSYFGLQTNGGVAGPAKTTQFSPSYIDMVRMKPKSVNSFTAASGSRTEVSFIFTLDNVVGTFDSNAKLTEATYTSGSRKAGTSITAVSASAGNYKEVLDKNINRFTAPMFGGTDGVDITEMDPFNNASMGSSETTAYEYNSVRRAIDSVSDAERVPMNVLAMPGIDTPTLTKHMINVAEGRGDALAVIDLAGGFTPRAESKDSLATRVGNVTTVIYNVKSRKLNSSYGCAYYPWVQILDTDASAVLNVPPSVAALGTFASSEKTSALWFAPAGFNRGGLTQGSAGLSVLNTDGQLTSKDRDKLYSVNVNPIAKFPAEGVVIFGQKTLQIKASALDRINVRRLLIYVKREISQIAAGVLFEQNIAATWNEFAAKADLFLEGVKIGGGLADYKVVLDDTTTTPDLVDRNIMYAKVFLKPARAIEFIAVDFIITRSGASFDD
jgi:phage tail sheath protein FI